MKLIFTLLLSATVYNSAFAQDTVKHENFSFHFQQTIITQHKPAFGAKYSGDNSLNTDLETQSSLTSTMYGAARLWKGAQVFFNPEISGGAGLSKTLGAAGFPNGETFRVGSASPSIYIARLYFRQIFEWGKEQDTIEAAANQLAGLRSKRYFSITAGKFGMADFFDGNAFSHDARTQFMNWSLMDNGGWDYPANTRGYTLGAMAEYGQPDWTLRFAFTLSTTEANGAVWDTKIGKANTQTLEFEKRYKLNGHDGTVRILGFRNNGKMGKYTNALNLSPPNVDTLLAYGSHKYGFGISADQYLTDDLGVFAKVSYNDGHTQTWYFTEIDRSVSFGANLKGTSWKRKDDELAIAFVANGLSAPHRNYLAAGGYGFIIGDGQLNYTPELIGEIYYKINAYQNKFFLSPDYQFIANPAYNKDRGPINVFSIRAHIEF
jgi:high affinity Mn2+ porin